MTSCAARVAPGDGINQLAARFDLGRALRKPLANGLFVPQGRAERFARLHVIDREIQRGLRLAHRHGGDHDALVLEVPHDRIEAPAHLAEDCVSRHETILEHQFSRV